jgi:hypothetical protein
MRARERTEVFLKRVERGDLALGEGAGLVGAGCRRGRGLRPYEGVRTRRRAERGGGRRSHRGAPGRSSAGGPVGDVAPAMVITTASGARAAWVAARLPGRNSSDASVAPLALVATQLDGATARRPARATRVSGGATGRWRDGASPTQRELRVSRPGAPAAAPPRCAAPLRRPAAPPRCAAPLAAPLRRRAPATVPCPLRRPLCRNVVRCAGRGAPRRCAAPRRQARLPPHGCRTPRRRGKAGRRGTAA